MSHSWLEFVKLFHQKNPNLSYQQALQEASIPYNKIKQSYSKKYNLLELSYSNNAPPPYNTPPPYNAPSAPPSYNANNQDAMEALVAKYEQKVAKCKQKAAENEAAMRDEMDKMRLEIEMKRKSEEDAARMETSKEFIAKEKPWFSNFDSWDKKTTLPANVRSFVDTFLKTIPTETVYAIHSIIVKNYASPSHMYGYLHPLSTSGVKLYIATDSKVYTVEIYGDIKDSSRDINKHILNYIIYPLYAFKAIVTFPSEPNPTFWRAVFSQMGQGEIQLSVVGAEYELYKDAIAKLEALFKSFR
jgi:hypothetical protein